MTSVERAPATGRIAEIRLHPFKSAGGFVVPSAEVDQVGLRYDRRWMAVDAEGRFVSQRTHPRMALVRTALEDSNLRMSAPACSSLLLPLAEPDAEDFTLHRVWYSDRYAQDCGDAASDWLSAFLDERVRIVRAVRPPGRPLLSEGEGRVCAGFADSSPALAISRASLDDLNARLDHPLTMDRFRPNLVVEGFAAFEEDQWGRRRVGGVPTHGGRPCPRCVATLVDQATGVRGVEPLRTLATFRRNAAGLVEFGVNVFFDAPGVFHAGDAVVTEEACAPMRSAT